MKTKTIILATVMSFAFLMCSLALLAEPVGTIFTYQGRLLDGNIAGGGQYDFQFKLYDDLNTLIGIQIGSAVTLEDIEVLGGYFIAELDFGNVFDGNNRWLEISVRPGSLTDPDAYTVLVPRQPITPAPYALYAKTAGSGAADADWIVSGSDMYSGVSGNVGIGTVSPQVKLSLGAEIPPIPKKLAIWDGLNDFYGFGSDWGRLIFYTNNTEKMTIMDNGRVGIGTTNPERALHIAGSGPRILLEGDASNPEVNFKITGDSASDVWALYKHSTTEDFRFYQGGDRVVFQYGTGNVGIGAMTPWSKLSVGGNGYGYTGIYGQGDSYGIYGLSAFGTAVYGINNDTSNEGVLGSSDYGVYGKNGSTGNEGMLGSSDYGVYGKNNNSGDYGYLGGSNHGVYGYSSGGTGVHGFSSDGSGVYGYSTNGNGVYGRNTTSGNFGTIGASISGVYGYSWNDYGVSGYSEIPNSAGVYGYSFQGYGVHGKCSNSYYGGKAGYFEGNVYVTGEMSAGDVTDRTPYPKDLATAYQAVMSMERLPDGQYEENNKENQLDHAKLSDFIRSANGDRNLSATVSCLNEVVKDLIKKVESQQEIIQTQNEQIQQLTQMMQTNNNLASLSQQEK